MISIIVPIYNVEKYLNRCVDSILAQTFTDFELILVDDGSPDNCGKICDEYAEKDSRIYVIHKENGGLSDARNAGLDIAKGEYVYFVDSDDYVEPDLLEKIIPYMQEGCQLVPFEFLAEYDDGSVRLFNYSAAGSYYSFKSDEDRLGFIINVFMKYGIGFEAWNRVFDRSIIEKYNLRFEDGTRILAEDMYFSLCYLAHIEKIYVLKDCPYHYCLRKGSIMSVNRDKFNLRCFDQLAQAVLNHYKESTSCQYLAQNFPLIYLAIFEHAEEILKRASGKTDIRYIKNAIYEELSDTAFFRTNMRSLKKYKNLLYKNSKKSYMYERLNILQYYSGSCYYLTALKNRLVIYFASLIDR